MTSACNIASIPFKRLVDEHVPQRSPRSPQDTKSLFSHARQKATADMASVTEEIISRQSEILSRKHDIAVWQVSIRASAYWTIARKLMRPPLSLTMQRKIHAAEKLIAGLQEQVDGLVREAREKQDIERELEGQMNAMLTAERLSEREWAALGNCLDHLDLSSSESR